MCASLLCSFSIVIILIHDLKRLKITRKTLYSVKARKAKHINTTNHTYPKIIDVHISQESLFIFLHIWLSIFLAYLGKYC
jgi:hypothetical protein